MLAIPNGYAVVNSRLQIIGVCSDLSNMFVFSNPEYVGDFRHSERSQYFMYQLLKLYHCGKTKKMIVNVREHTPNLYIKKLPKEFSFKPNNYAPKTKAYIFSVHDFPIISDWGLESVDDVLVDTYRSIMIDPTKPTLLELPYVAEETPTTNVQHSSNITLKPRDSQATKWALR